METQDTSHKFAANGNSIITLQFGDYSNLIGYQFWNAQLQSLNNEIYEPSVFFYSSTGKTIFPRSLSVDVKGTFSGDFSLKEETKLNASDSINENINIEESISHKVPFGKHETVKVKEERNFHELSQVKYGDLFDKYGMGISEFEREGEEIMDKFRYLMEQCDYLESLLCIVDADSAFAGIAFETLQTIEDDFSKRPIFTIAVSPFILKKKENQGVLNNALCLQNIAGISSIYLPLSSSHFSPSMFPNLNVKISNPLHTSAILAASLDSIVLPLRMKERKTIDRYLNLFSKGSLSNIISLNFAFHFQSEKLFPLHSNKSLVDLSFPLDKKISPISELAVIRGNVDSNTIGAKESFSSLTKELVSIKNGFSIPSQFPGILKSQEKEVNCVAHLQHTRGIHKYLQELAENFDNLPKLKLQQEIDEIDTVLEIKNTLWTIADNYSPPE